MRDIFTLFHHARHKNKLQQEGRFIFIYKECVIHTHTDTCLNSVYGAAGIAQLLLDSEHQHMQKQRRCFIVLYAVTPDKKAICGCVFTG